MTFNAAQADTIAEIFDLSQEDRHWLQTPPYKGSLPTSFSRGKGKFVITEYVPTEGRSGPRFPLLLTTGRILSQYNVDAYAPHGKQPVASRGRAGDQSAGRAPPVEAAE